MGEKKKLNRGAKISIIASVSALLLIIFLVAIGCNMQTSRTDPTTVGATSNIDEIEATVYTENDNSVENVFLLEETEKDNTDSNTNKTTKSEKSTTTTKSSNTTKAQSTTKKQSTTKSQSTTKKASTTKAPVTNGNSSKQHYVLNTNTGKFHYPECNDVAKMKEEHKYYFYGTRDEVIKKEFENGQTYSPCGHCKP